MQAARSSEDVQASGSGPRHAPGSAAGTSVRRTSPKRAHQAPLEVGDHGPEAGGVQGRGIAGHVPEVGGEEIAEAGQRAYASRDTDSSRTTMDFDVGVLLMAAVESRGTRTLVSGK